MRWQLKVQQRKEEVMRLEAEKLAKKNAKKNREIADIQIMENYDYDGCSLYTQEQRDMLSFTKDCIFDCLRDIDPAGEDTTYHELMLWATAKAMHDLPLWKQNIYITRMLYTSNQQMADQMMVCRQTLTKTLTSIKELISDNAQKYINHYK